MAISKSQASVLLAGAAALCVACGSAATDESPQSTWGNAVAVEELAIGIELGDEEYMFGTVNDLAVGADGTIFVVDRNPLLVRVYDTQGAHVRDVGGEGQGPGEFNRPPAIDVLPDGKLVTWDYAASRVSFFAPEGEFVGSFSSTTGLGGSESLQVDHEGNVNIRVSNQQSGSEADILFAKYSLEGERLGEVVLPPTDRVGRGFFLEAEGVGAPSVIETQSVLSPLGYGVSGRNDAYAIELLKPDGTVTVEREVAPARIRAEEGDEWRAFRQAVIEMSRARGIDPQYDPDPIPDTKTYFRRLFVGDDGRIWVFRCVEAVKRDDVFPHPDRPERPSLTWREPWTFDVFEPDGTFLGSVRVPELFEPFVFRGDRIWGALIDADGVERVVRLRVVPEA